MMNIIERPSPNFDERNGADIEFLILHYTGMKTAEEALARLCDPVAKVSAHYTVDEDGTVYRHVDEDKRAWHAGVSSWRGQTDINAKSIGIEIVNPGHEFGYREFPKAQLDAVKKLCQDILVRHKTIKHVLAHSDIAPTRKQDPGELFPWQDFARDGVGVWPSEGSASYTGDVYDALEKIGYDITDKSAALVAFQRHYVPEVFEEGSEGKVCDLTRGRLSGLIKIAN
jgi:N-acetylmuramoyl-L-alanine amidase